MRPAGGRRLPCGLEPWRFCPAGPGPDGLVFARWSWPGLDRFLPLGLRLLAPPGLPPFRLPLPLPLRAGAVVVRRVWLGLPAGWVSMEFFSARSRLVLESPCCLIRWSFTSMACMFAWCVCPLSRSAYAGFTGAPSKAPSNSTANSLS